MKYPKKWVEALRNGIHNGMDLWDDTDCEHILDYLSEIGALKEPPRPREYGICPECYQAISPGAGLDLKSCCRKNATKLIRVREVEEE